MLLTTTQGSLDEECGQSLSVKASLSHLRLTKGPDYFPGSDISQSVAHYCNRGLQGVSWGNVCGNDKKANTWILGKDAKESCLPAAITCRNT